MERGTVNRRRGLRPGQLPARYWRLRYADDCGERLAEYEPPHYQRYDDEDDGWPKPDPRQVALDQALAELCMCIRGAVPFNTLPLNARPSACPAPLPAKDPIEVRLIAHLDRITTLPLVDVWASEHTAALAELEAIAEQHFRGELAPVLGLALFQPFWLRSPTTWRPSETAPLASLIEHLLLAYPAPRFLYAAAADISTLAELRWLAYLIALGQGGSLRRLTELGSRCWPDEWAVIPQKLVACLGRVREQLSPRAGLMEAEVLRLGGSELEHRRLCSDNSFVIDPSSNELAPPELELWRTTVGWLTRNRDELEDQDTTLVLAWARHMHIELRRAGECFRWRGRTAASVLREATAYRQSWYRYRAKWLSWRHHGWDWQGRHAELDWSICELTNSTQLQEESQAMSHCVYSYDHACWSGRTAIFSLRQDGRRRVTIELQLASKRVVQAKRACNQQPSALELTVIEQWRRGLLAG